MFKICGFFFFFCSPTGFNVVYSGCPIGVWHSLFVGYGSVAVILTCIPSLLLCFRDGVRCKTGRQFDEFYKAQENGVKYG